MAQQEAARAAREQAQRELERKSKRAARRGGGAVEAGGASPPTVLPDTPRQAAEVARKQRLASALLEYG